MSSLVNEQMVSGILLAGGKSTRFGRSKALEPFDGQPLISRVARRLAHVANEMIVVVDSKATAETLPIPKGAKVVVDAYPGKGPLGAIYTGLTAAQYDWAVTAACDMPFLNQQLLGYMLALRPTHDAVAPVVDERPEPIHALYSKSCLPAMKFRLEAGRLRTADLLQDLSVAYVQEYEMRRFDPELISFMNVNTQEDLERALTLARKGW